MAIKKKELERLKDHLRYLETYPFIRSFRDEAKTLRYFLSKFTASKRRLK